MQFLSNLQIGVQKDLLRALERAPRQIKITGTDSPLLLSLLASRVFRESYKPSVLLLPGKQALQQTEESLKSLGIDSVWSLPEFDVWPYGGLYPGPTLAIKRIGWCARLMNSEPGLYLATARALNQWSIPKDVLQGSVQRWAVGQEVPTSLQGHLDAMGYVAVPFVEDVGQCSLRGSVLDIFSPYYTWPLRIELFGDSIESIRWFSPATQRSLQTIPECWITPCRETFWDPEHRMLAAQRLKEDFLERGIHEEPEALEILQNLSLGKIFPGSDYLTKLFYSEAGRPKDFFPEKTLTWVMAPADTLHSLDSLFQKFKEERASQLHSPLSIAPQDLLIQDNLFEELKDHPQIHLSTVDLLEDVSHHDDDLKLRALVATPKAPKEDTLGSWCEKIKEDLSLGFSVVLGLETESQRQRMTSLFRQEDIRYVDYPESEDMDTTPLAPGLYISSRSITETLRFPEDRILIISSRTLFPKKRAKGPTAQAAMAEALSIASFQDLKVGDNIVHSLHGVGVFDGLKVMNIHGVEAEYLEIRYKGSDRLYLPIYRLNQVHKYGGSNTSVLDKLGGPGWEKTKGRVKKRLREMADDLLKLYAQRKTVRRAPILFDVPEYEKFCDGFPFEETPDQLRAIEEIQSDFAKDAPMDRLICGDVGFGKTEVAMRAAFMMASQGHQVAVLAPTTILTFQHFENFKKRFEGFSHNIKLLNRFVSSSDARKTVEELKSGNVDIVIGTHKILNPTIQFKNLGLLIVDEEQKFGVGHKEKIRKLRSSIDTLAMSATPLPRTLNMSLIGMRDLSLINSAPLDRLPTRTFVTRYDPEVVKKAILSEVDRGGQVFFLHNRVQSIYSVADELRQLLPGIRLGIGHGQMDEGDLEKTMIDFYQKRIDVLLCTTIIEAGMDVANANTMFIADAQRFGLSQLYQLRGRIGRSKQRAYCYLLIPPNRTLEKDAQERLRIIQENTALGSGLVIAQHDLELRGAGTLLGEEQSGHIDSVGYEMFLELMEEALSEARGEEVVEAIYPEINLPIPALIPSSYIPDLRIRLSLYRKLSGVRGPDDLDSLESEIRDQFGKIPPEVSNLMGFMLLTSLCKTLGVRDLSSGQKSISLTFSERTPLSPTVVVDLALRERQKYTLTPDNRLNIRVEPRDWTQVLDELNRLVRLLD